jgi:zinc/manganese transport system substrate-binding protein
VKAVFVENISNPRVIERIAKEADVALGGTLYSDALSEPGGAAGTYIDMMRHNTRLFAEAMK